jgi:hypothetical protein
MSDGQKGDAMKESQQGKDRSDIVAALALAVGLSALPFGGALAGLIGAAVGAVGGAIVIRAIDRRQPVA